MWIHAKYMAAFDLRKWYRLLIGWHIYLTVRRSWMHSTIFHQGCRVKPYEVILSVIHKSSLNSPNSNRAMLRLTQLQLVSILVCQNWAPKRLIFCYYFIPLLLWEEIFTPHNRISHFVNSITKKRKKFYRKMLDYWEPYIN